MRKNFFCLIVLISLLVASHIILYPQTPKPVVSRPAAVSAPAGEARNPIEELYRDFQNPPRRYTIRPYWFWNDRVEGARLAQQIQMMVDRGVYGASVFPIDGLRTPYLTDAWFQAFGEALAKAQQVGFDLNFIIDFDWPDGEARDPWLLDPVQGRVVKADPAFRMRSLGYVRKQLQGPTELTVEAPDKIEFAVAARWLGADQIDGDSLTLIESGIDGPRLTWRAPQGDWEVVPFYLMPSQEVYGGQVDLMNSKAIQTYIRIALDPYYQRFQGAFGKNISYLIADHEGAYGTPIAWTPELFATFQRMKGYDLRKNLPYLFFEGGRMTPKVRCDYFDVVSEIYGRSFFDQLRTWAESRHTHLISHLWESPLSFNDTTQGNFFGIERRLSLAGNDILGDREHSPRDFMEAASVAHFERKGYWVEPGLEGNDSYIDLGRMRTAIYVIGAWGATLVTPYFNYESRKVLYPPDWFYDQPFWKYFHAYEDPERRITMMNDGGRKVSSIAIFQPLETVWAASQPVFDNRIARADENKIAPLTEQDYSALIHLLTFNQWNYDIMDSHYLEQAQLTGSALRLGGDDYRVLILPPLTTVRRSTFQKVQRFFEAGGIVLALGTLPRNSMENGEDDTELKTMVEATFGTETGQAPFSLHQNTAGGRAYFFPGERIEASPSSTWPPESSAPLIPQHVAEILPILEAQAPKDLRIIDGPTERLIFNHMVRQGVHFYWIVNDTHKTRTNTLLLPQKGEPQRWQADTGVRLPVFSRETEKGTEVRLRLDPGDACYLVFGAPKKNQETTLVASNLDEFNILSQTADAVRLAVKSEAHPGANYAEFLRKGQRYRGEINIPENLKAIALSDTWQFHPAPARVEVPYARTMVDADGSAGTAWASIGLDDSGWPEQWVSKEVSTIRDWWVLGPFANLNHVGFFRELPPEKTPDLEASYEGRGGQTLRWQPYASPQYDVNLAIPFQNKDELFGVGYALTYLYAPGRRQVEVRVAAPNFAAWVNGKRIMIQHTRAYYYQPRWDWGLAEKVWLDPGWNTLLLKLENDRGDFGLDFVSWVLAPEAGGVPSQDVSGLVNSPTKAMPDQGKIENGYRWYRYHIPPGTVALVPPSTQRATEVFINGQPARAGKDGVVRYTWLPGQPMIAALCLKGSPEIYDGPRFLTGATPFHLLSWSDTGLENFSGDAVYETNFSLPPEFLKHNVQLDLGNVGVAAEVWVNGQRAGLRVWEPFTFDITKLARAGENRLRVVITNSEGNKIAVGPWRENLARIRINGLLGPVQIRPYLDGPLVCKKQ
jgi:hypothetical protein